MKPKFLLQIMVASVALLILVSPAFVSAQDVKKPLEKVRLTVPAKSLTFVPYYFGKSQRLYEKEGIDLELIVMRPPIGVTALQAGEVDYSATGGLSVRAAMKGLPLRTIMFIQTRLSFSLIGQPGMIPAKIKNVARSAASARWRTMPPSP
jgi:ABC-type nitrate/sulfonate/bicarbonate transport system substrate-binding protein